MPQLQCVAQSYAWGKHGHDSLVAQLKVHACIAVSCITTLAHSRLRMCGLQAGGDAAFHVDPTSAYAELWCVTT